MAEDDIQRRDALDAVLTRQLRGPRATQPLPAPAADEPTDEELLRYLDGALASSERELFEERLARRPYAPSRAAIVADALSECGWAGPGEPQAGCRTIQAAARYVFSLSRGVLTFLRGTGLPLALEPALAVRSHAPAEPPSSFELEQR